MVSAQGPKRSVRRSLGGRLRAACALAALALIGAADKPGVGAHVGEQIDLSRYELTFDEPFDKLDVTPWGLDTPKSPRQSRWIAHTPWAGDFGDARFIDPTPTEPFKTVNGILQIEMKRKDGRWQSGLISSGDKYGRGFLQSGGYFEMRAKLPGSQGVWPAFWLGANSSKGKPTPEIDIIEYYGQFPMSYVATTHVWQDGKSVSGEAIRIFVPEHSLEAGWHTFGASIDAKNLIFYLDRKEVARRPTLPEYLEPVYMMVDLGAGGGWPIDGMKDPSVMYVDYVRAYRLKR